MSDYPLGFFFDVGNAMVTCTGSAGPTCSFDVPVNDTQHPTISAPADASYQSASELPAAFASEATASDNCAAPCWRFRVQQWPTKPVRFDESAVNVTWR